MEIDASVMNSLPLAQRLKLMTQLRKEQVRRYNEWLKRSPVLHKVNRKSKVNKKGVQFEDKLVLYDAATCFDDRLVLKHLEQGISPDISNAAGLTLLHRCCVTDNQSVAELLLSHGADVNVQDSDLWTPLHCACECDNAEMVALLLENGADPLILDVDGNLPIDHTPIGSQSRQVLEEHLEEKGVLATHLAALRKAPARRMIEDIRELVETPGADASLPNKEGITLFHVASANGYKEVVKLLLIHKADINAQDIEGLTPLHVAAKFNQLKMVQLLIRYLADPTIPDLLGRRPVDLTASGPIAECLMDYEKSHKDPEVDQAPELEYEEGIYDFELEAPKVPTKTVSSLENLSKVDAIMEAKLRLGDTLDSVHEMETPLTFGKVSSPEPRTIEIKVPAVAKNDDLCKLPEVSEQIITKELQKRYSEDRIYTYIGDILVIVNPFKILYHHDRSVSRMYTQAVDRSAMSPHAFATAESAYRLMKVEREPQCFVISGESGAGKTEGAKYVIQHLLMVAVSDETNLNARIEQVNPLLEAFGNAQTVINDNSSRFGKYLDLMFNDNGIVQGAKIYEYLLEKSRVVYQEEGETNFHVFYLLYAGLSPDERLNYKLGSATSHRYLRSLGDKIHAMLGSDNLEKFVELRDCLKFIGFTNDDIDNLFISLSAVLHLGDIVFKPVGNNDSAKIDNPEMLEKVSSLLQVPAEDLGSCMEAEITVTRGEYIRKERSVSQASDCRDALAKSLYGRLFSWIVNSINQLIQPLEGSQHTLQMGILDIFGFENFPKNSFEQLCINLANEQLQYHFNRHIFEMELQDCASDGVRVDNIAFTNNIDIIELFLGKPQGILAILDEQSRFPKATDQSLATKLHSAGRQHALRYLAPKDKGTTFTVVHYAGKVNYDLHGVLEKNRETLPASILFTMKTSNSLVIKEMFRSRLTRTGSLAPSNRQRRSRTDRKSGAFDFFLRRSSKEEKKPRRTRPDGSVIGTDRKGPSTAAFHFKNSLADLMSKISHSTPHFIRCIKPNQTKSPGEFQADYVQAQLRHTGVLQMVRIRKQGYALRLHFEDFRKRYELLDSLYATNSPKTKDVTKCQDVLKHCNIDDYQVGRTKVFLRASHPEILAKMTTDLSPKLIAMQTAIRCWTDRKKFQEFQNIAKEQEEKMNAFLREITSSSTHTENSMTEGQSHDTEREVARLEEERRKEEEKRRKEEEEKKKKEEEEKEKKAEEFSVTFRDGNVGRGASRKSMGLRRTDDVSQSLLALDKVIDEYDPYRLNETSSVPPEGVKPPISGGGHGTSGDPDDDSRNDEIRKSLEALDSVLEAYDEGDALSLSGSTRRAPPSTHESLTTIASQFADTTNPPETIGGGDLRRHSSALRTGDEDLPPPPPDILRPGAGGRPHSIHSTTGSELYSRSKRASGPPPQVPRRNPETRLSSGSTESQAAGKQDRMFVTPFTPRVLESQEQLDISQFQFDDHQGYGLTHQSSQEYSPKHGYHGYPGDAYSPPAARNGDTSHYHGHSLGGAPPAPSLPPPLPPGRGSVGSAGSMPGYPAPPFPSHVADPINNGPRSISPPPPPPGFDMGAVMTSPPSSTSSSQPEELYETRLPSHMDEVPARLLHQQQQQHYGGESENFYGVQLPSALHGGLDNGYPAPHELYETTLPRPGLHGCPPPPPPGPSVVRRSSSSSSGSHSHTQSPYAGSRETLLPPEYLGGSTASPDTDFPPPPPPQFFQPMPPAPSSMPGSPQRPPPPTLPKPNKPGKASHLTSPPAAPPINGSVPPPPPPISTIPRGKNHHNFQHHGPPPPPPPQHHHHQHHQPQTDSANLAAQLQGITLKPSSPPEDKLTRSPQVDAHTDLISQIHIGVTLRKSPAGKKIRGADEPRVDDSGDTFSETASVTSSGSGEDYSGSSTGSKAPPPTLPKPNKPSPIHSNTMPSGGSTNSNNSTTSDDVDVSEVAYEGSTSMDVTQVDGYAPIPDGCPDWKRAMLERKNNQLLDQARKAKAEKEKESEKWKGIPEWKKALIMEREKKKEDEQNPQEEEMRKRKEEELRLQNMPEWKRALYIKKKGEL